MTTRLLLSLLVILGLATRLEAQRGTAITDEVQKLRLQQAVELLEKTLADCLDSRLQDLLYQDDTNDPITYETASLRTALQKLRSMITSGRVRSHAFAGTELGQALTAPGTHADVILVSDELVESAAVSGNASSEVRLRTQSVVLIAETLLNEIVHVFQEAEGISDEAHCDAERDSDVLSKKFMGRILKSLASDASSCTAHATLLAVDSDPDRIPGWSDLLAALGVDAANAGTQILDLQRLVKEEDKKFRDRIDKIFVPFLSAIWPYGNRGHEHRRAGKIPCPDPTRTSVGQQDVTGSTFAIYGLPPGSLVVNSFFQLNGQGQMVLYVLSIDPTFRLRLHWWVDADGDGLPEMLEATAPLLFPGFLSGDPGLDGVGIHGVFPEDLHPNGDTEGILFQDYLDGGFYSVPLGIDGEPLDAKLVFSDPALRSAGGYDAFGEIRRTGASDLRFVFGTRGRLARFGGSPAVWFDLLGANPTTLGTVVYSGAGSTLAAALAPSNHVGIDVLDRNLPGSFRLYGNPGTTIDLTTWEPGGIVTVASGVAQNDGRTGTLGSNPPIRKNRIYVVGDGTDSWSELVPTLGRSVGTFRSDENGDGLVDRLDLTVSPARLHLSSGIPGLGPDDPHAQHLYELVLEDRNPTRFDAAWGAPDRLIRTLEGSLALTPLPGSNPPLYAQSIVDLDGDGSADETVVIRRASNNPDFLLEVIDGVPSLPAPVQAIALPQGFEPDHVDLLDIDLDGDLDFCCPNALQGGEGIAFLNDGTGQLTLTFQPLRPGTGEDFEMRVFVDGLEPACSSLAPTVPGDLFVLTTDSPLGTFDFDPLVVLGQFFVTGNPPLGVPAFGVHVDPNGSPAPFALVDGGIPGPLGPSEVQLPAGNVHGYLIPPGLGGFSLMLQSLTLSPSAQNGFFPTSHAVEVRFD